jgi:EF-P beta-lysylation protein EpmB
MGTHDAPLPQFAEPSGDTLALPSWQAALQTAVREPGELLRLLDLSPAALGAPANVAFPLLVPRSFVARMRKGDPHDPLLRQVWPHADERVPADGFNADPVREQGLATHGVIQKYPGRVLLIASGTCPLHCRYCFRRDFPYSSQLAARADWSAALAALRDVPEVSEAILSGGDPLSLSNRRLADLVAKLERVPSVETLRVHTRFPVVLPERVDAGLLEVLRGTRLRTVFVVHCNHANELDEAAAAALGALRETVDHLLNQSVLLAGVKDDVTALAALSERLFACGALPYYLHLLDPVEGAAHFDVGEERGLALVAELRTRLAGYLVPRLVREVPGELSKTAVG